MYILKEKIGLKHWKKEQSVVIHIQAPALGIGAQCLMSWHTERKKRRLLRSQMHKAYTHRKSERLKGQVLFAHTLKHICKSAKKNRWIPVGMHQLTRVQQRTILICHNAISNSLRKTLRASSSLSLRRNSHWPPTDDRIHTAHTQNRKSWLK